MTLKFKADRWKALISCLGQHLFEVFIGFLLFILSVIVIIALLLKVIITLESYDCCAYNNEIHSATQQQLE
jgi:hypothetical protein